MKTWTSRWTASARSTLRCPAGSRVSPKSDSRAGRSTSSGSSRSRAHAPSTRSAGSGTPIRSRSRRHSSACHSPSASSPRAHARTISGRCSAYRSNSSARCRTAREAPSPPRRIHLLARAAEMRRQARQPRLPKTLVNDLEQRPDRPLRQPRIAHPPRSPTPSPPRPRRAAAATGTRRSRTPHRDLLPPRRADPTSAARASAPCHASARRRPRARTDRATGRPAARGAPRPGRRPAQLDGRGARRRVCLARRLDRSEAVVRTYS